MKKILVIFMMLIAVNVSAQDPISLIIKEDYATYFEHPKVISML